MTKDEFEGLVDRYLRGEATSAEEKVVDDFFKIQEKKKTLQHYTLSEQMWSSIQGRLTKEATSSRRQFARNDVSKSSSWRLLFPVSVAASLIIGIFLANKIAYLKTDSSSQVVTAYSANGQKSLITLTDGSKIYLNSASSVSYPETFSADKREIALTGEAFFEVTRDESKPFIVKTGNVVTQVLGTSFNINAFTTSEISITVATGKVKVSAEQWSNGSARPKEVVLFPNQQATYQAGTHSLKTAAVDVGRFTAWKNNNLYFESTSLRDAALQLERWYGVSIEFENEDVKNCVINGEYKDMALTNVLESIQYMYGQVKFRFIDDRKVLLYGKGCK